MTALSFISHYLILTLSTLLFLLALTAVPVMAGIGMGMMVSQLQGHK